jgi:hypothetical protein
MITKERPFKIEWRCFACGRRFRSKRSLYGHLNCCYWYKQFKDHIEDAPFYRETPTRQLRYYWRNRKHINAERAARYAEEKQKKIKLPRSLRR